MRDSVSVILGYQGGEGILLAGLHSLAKDLAANDEIVVVINTSDPRCHEIPFEDSRLKIVRVNSAIGNAAAMNLGAEASSSPYLVTFDFDLVVLPGWKGALIDSIKNKAESVVSSLLINPFTNSTAEFGIAYSQFNGAHPYQDLPIGHALLSEEAPRQAACGGGMIIPREIYDKVGGYDENFFSMYGDMTFCARLRNHNVGIFVTPMAKAYHFGGWTSLRDRTYKSELVKGDSKGAFFHIHGSSIKVDLDQYYKMAVEAIPGFRIDDHRYFACNLMNVADPNWYAEVMENIGLQSIDRMTVPTGRRDADRESLFDNLGYHVMTMKSPIAYFVDRFVSVLDNAYWWKNRCFVNDLVIDRNANVLRVDDILGSRMGN